MIDLNTLLTNALTAAAQQALAPFTARIEQLERHRDELRDRINQITYGNEGGPEFVTVAEVDQQLENLDRRLDSIGRRVDRLLALESRLESLEGRHAAGVNPWLEFTKPEEVRDIANDVQAPLDARVAELEEKLENANARLGIFHTDMGEVEHKIGRLWERFNNHDDFLDVHGSRLVRVEDRVTKVENRVEREIAAGTTHERIQLVKDAQLCLEGRVGELEDRLKFRSCEGADPVPLETVVRHHSEALVHLETQVEQLDLFDEDYLRTEIVRPIARREAELALENFDIKEAIEMSDIDVGDLLNVERAVHNVMSGARVRIEF